MKGTEVLHNHDSGILENLGWNKAFPDILKPKLFSLIRWPEIKLFVLIWVIINLCVHSTCQKAFRELSPLILLISQIGTAPQPDCVSRGLSAQRRSRSIPWCITLTQPQGETAIVFHFSWAQFHQSLFSCGKFLFWWNHCFSQKKCEFFRWAIKHPSENRSEERMNEDLHHWRYIFCCEKNKKYIWINFVANSSSKIMELYQALIFICNSQRQSKKVWI